MKKEENYFIDFLRFIFSICILFYHSWIFSGAFGLGILNHGYLGVDFYFIVTGYLMINSMYKNKNKNLDVINDSFNFIWKKIKSIMPSLIVTFLIGLVFVYGRKVFFDIKLLLSNRILPELFQLGIFGYELTVNSSWWYISAMIFVLMLLYPLSKKYENNYCIYIAPLIILFTLGIVNMYRININNPNEISFFLRNGFYKALIFIPLGNISYAISNKIKEKDFSKFKRIILTILEIVLYLILILNLHFIFMDTFLFAILLTLNISLTFSNVTYMKNIFKHHLWKELGIYGFYIYLCNISIRTYIAYNYMNLNLTYKSLLLRFVLISLLTSLFLYLIVGVLYKRIILKKFSNK